MAITDSRTFPVFDETGRIGVLIAPARFLDARSEKTIRLDSGDEIRVPGAALKVQPDGSFRLLRPREEAQAEGPKPSAELPAPQPPPAAAPDSAFLQDEYEIEHVPVGRVIDAPMVQRQEGDTIVLPVIEEVLVYQKKLFLREEIRITRRKKPVGEVRKFEQPKGEQK